MKKSPANYNIKSNIPSSTYKKKTTLKMQELEIKKTATKMNSKGLGSSMSWRVLSCIFPDQTKMCIL